MYAIIYVQLFTKAPFCEVFDANYSFNTFVKLSEFFSRLFLRHFINFIAVFDYNYFAQIGMINSDIDGFKARRFNCEICDESKSIRLDILPSEVSEFGVDLKNKIHYFFIKIYRLLI